ncbi:MAG: hypothetical protein IPI22_00080 [Bacteroidetes bacterium]|nr:hypothetical protein [Bacteroidota bacterium]
MQKVYILVLFFLISQMAKAQEEVFTPKPSSIVFILHISTNKIEGLKKRGLHSDIKDVIAADYEINSSIMQDFKNNFTFCNVYFCYDTQLNYILEKQWNKVTFYDFEHLTRDKRIEVSGIDNFIICEVNYPPPTEYPTIDEKGKVHEPEYTVEYANGRDYGVVCYDQDYKLLKNKLRFTNIAMLRTGNIFKPETLHYHFTGAKKFQARLEKYYTKYR